MLNMLKVIVEKVDNMGKRVFAWTDKAFQQRDGNHKKESNRNVRSKNTVTEMKNVFNELVSRLSRAEEIEEFEDK